MKIFVSAVVSLPRLFARDPAVNASAIVIGKNYTGGRNQKEDDSLSRPSFWHYDGADVGHEADGWSATVAQKGVTGSG